MLQREDLWFEDSQEVLRGGAFRITQRSVRPPWPILSSEVASAVQLRESLEHRLRSTRFLAWQQEQLSGNLQREQLALRGLREDAQRLQEEARCQVVSATALRENQERLETELQRSLARCSEELSEQRRATERAEAATAASKAEADLATSSRELECREFDAAQKALLLSEQQAEELQRQGALVGDQQQEIDAREAALHWMESAWACRVQQAFSVFESLPGTEEAEDLEAIQAGVVSRLVDALLRKDPCLSSRLEVVHSALSDSWQGLPLSPEASPVHTTRNVRTRSYGSYSEASSSAATPQSGDASTRTPAALDEDASSPASPCKEASETVASATSSPLPSKSRLVGLPNSGISSAPDLHQHQRHEGLLSLPAVVTHTHAACQLLQQPLVPPEHLTPHTPMGQLSPLAAAGPRAPGSPLRSSPPPPQAPGAVHLPAAPSRPLEQCISHQPPPTWCRNGENLQSPKTDGPVVRKACSGTVTPHGRAALGSSSYVAGGSPPTAAAPLAGLLMRPPASWASRQVTATLNHNQNHNYTHNHNQSPPQPPLGAVVRAPGPVRTVTSQVPTVPMQPQAQPQPQLQAAAPLPAASAQLAAARLPEGMGMSKVPQGHVVLRRHGHVAPSAPTTARMVMLR